MDGWQRGLIVMFAAIAMVVGVGIAPLAFLLFIVIKAIVS